MTEVEKTNSGLKLEGSWDEITELCFGLEKVLIKYVSDHDEIKRYDEWMPRVEENEEILQEKTVEDASMNEQKVEKEFEGTEEELDKAEDKIKESFHDIANGESPVRDLKEALKEIETLIGAKSIESLRKVEKTIYKSLMLKFNPSYFDTEDFSVSLEHKDEDDYIFCINVTDEDLRSHIQDELGP